MSLCVCVMFGVCVSLCVPLYTSTHLPTFIWMSLYIYRSFSNTPKFSILKHSILVQNGPSLSSHISLFTQCLVGRASPEKHKVFLCVSFALLEFWNHLYTALQGLSYVTITTGFPTRWKLKEYGCRLPRLCPGAVIQEVGHTSSGPRHPRNGGFFSSSQEMGVWKE